jgi:hypothetical protein
MIFHFARLLIWPLICSAQSMNSKDRSPPPVKINILKLTLPYFPIPSLPSDFDAEHIDHGKFLRFRRPRIWLILLCKIWVRIPNVRELFWGYRCGYRDTYLSWRSRPVSQRVRTDMAVLAHIREQYSLSLGSYGRPRMTFGDHRKGKLGRGAAGK